MHSGILRIAKSSLTRDFVELCVPHDFSVVPRILGLYVTVSNKNLGNAVRSTLSQLVWTKEHLEDLLHA